ncbi:MAG: DUF116 domain-containing protein [Chitinivibrionales bacterium]|nr:DUF116 domain-containing protein [Chitinivibrionales bacterium]MBD3396035.1 DUF116 domain-containing protein [Chitinivibrionales bacterium]
MWRAAWTKATFLGFCWISYFIFVGLAGIAYYLVHPRLASIHAWIDHAALGFTAGFALLIGAGLFLISATALTGIDLLYPHRKRSVTVKALFPIAATLSQLAGVNRNKLRTSFVKVNNALTKAQRGRIRGDRILILLPHCLQIDVCNRKITTTVDNCVQCGRCPVGDLAKLGKKYGLKIEVVNGGTLARSKVVSFRPDGIVAVACERDLTLGIQDVYPVPVYGVINDRPNGPCFNTCVDMDLVEDAVKFFRQDHPAAQPAS